MAAKPQAKCPACPKCKSAASDVTLVSKAGVYCRCQDCGHVWHTDDNRSE